MEAILSAPVFLYGLGSLVHMLLSRTTSLQHISSSNEVLQDQILQLISDISLSGHSLEEELREDELVGLLSHGAHHRWKIEDLSTKSGDHPEQRLEAALIKLDLIKKALASHELRRAESHHREESLRLDLEREREEAVSSVRREGETALRAQESEFSRREEIGHVVDISLRGEPFRFSKHDLIFYTSECSSEGDPDGYRDGELTLIPEDNDNVLLTSLGESLLSSNERGRNVDKMKGRRESIYCGQVANIEEVLREDASIPVSGASIPEYNSSSCSEVHLSGRIENHSKNEMPVRPVKYAIMNRITFDPAITTQDFTSEKEAVDEYYEESFKSSQTLENPVEIEQTITRDRSCSTRALPEREDHSHRSMEYYGDQQKETETNAKSRGVKIAGHEKTTEKSFFQLPHKLHDAFGDIESGSPCNLEMVVTALPGDLEKTSNPSSGESTSFSRKTDQSCLTSTSSRIQTEEAHSAQNSSSHYMASTGDLEGETFINMKSSRIPSFELSRVTQRVGAARSGEFSERISAAPLVDQIKQEWETDIQEQTSARMTVAGSQKIFHKPLTFAGNADEDMQRENTRYSAEERQNVLSDAQRVSLNRATEEPVRFMSRNMLFPFETRDQPYLKALTDSLSKKRVLILGDMSARMGVGDRLIRQCSFVKILCQSSLSRKSPISIGAWSTHLKWVSSQLGKPKWRKDARSVSDDLQKLLRFPAECGSNMEICLKCAISLLPDATDMVVFCHGHAHPFDVSATSVSSANSAVWKTFHATHLPSTRVHFVGVGLGCDRLALESMASTAGGAFIFLPTST